MKSAGNGGGGPARAKEELVADALTRSMLPLQPHYRSI
jgi:hypothetical protein